MGIQLIVRLKISVEIRDLIDRLAECVVRIQRPMAAEAFVHLQNARVIERVCCRLEDVLLENQRVRKREGRLPVGPWRTIAKIAIENARNGDSAIEVVGGRDGKRSDSALDFEAGLLRVRVPPFVHNPEDHREWQAWIRSDAELREILPRDRPSADHALPQQPLINVGRCQRPASERIVQSWRAAERNENLLDVAAGQGIGHVGDLEVVL